jgi:hypothetical protein
MEYDPSNSECKNFIFAITAIKEVHPTLQCSTGMLPGLSYNLDCLEEQRTVLKLVLEWWPRSVTWTVCIIAVQIFSERQFTKRAVLTKYF